MSVRYWVTKLVDDPFRNEPRNVGVVVKAGGELAARFFGENDNLQIDGRRIQWMRHPEVYRQWVDYWRGEINQGDLDEVLGSSTVHYKVVSGGEVTDVAHDSLSEVVNYLYSVLVSEGGFREALVASEEAEEVVALVALKTDIANVFKDSHLLADEDDLLMPHPIRIDVKVDGCNVTHSPSFVQKNGSLYVMEPVDFTKRQRTYSKDHAGWAAYMFKDIRNTKQNVDAYALVRMTDADQKHEEVKYSLQLLRNEAEIINWSDPSAQEKFIAGRCAVAKI